MPTDAELFSLSALIIALIVNGLILQTLSYPQLKIAKIYKFADRSFFYFLIKFLDGHILFAPPLKLLTGTILKSIIIANFCIQFTFQFQFPYWNA